MCFLSLLVKSHCVLVAAAVADDDDLTGNYNKNGVSFYYNYEDEREDDAGDEDRLCYCRWCCYLSRRGL